MSLKVPRNFQTFSEDSIIEQYAGQRRKFAHQDRIARRNQQDSQNLTVIGKLAVVAVVLIVAAVAFKPVLSFVQSLL